MLPHFHLSQPFKMSGKFIIILALIFTTGLARKERKHTRKYVDKYEDPKGIQCYNCLSYDHHGCWDPLHPEVANLTIPNIDCYIPDLEFTCIIITAENSKLVETDQEIGPVRVRTCIPTKEFTKKKPITYNMCSKISKELSESEVFSKIEVTRPKCTLCTNSLCTE